MVVIARCAKRAVAIQLDCFVAALLAMTVRLLRDVGMRPDLLRAIGRTCEMDGMEEESCFRGFLR